jgi:hypothetical protein
MRICCVLASDANFYDQMRNTIATINAARPTLTGADLDIAAVGIDLAEHQIAALKADGIIVHEDLDAFPQFQGGPRHAYALTCRPFMPQILPGYDGYIWVDSDIRFVRPSGLQFYVSALGIEQVTAVVAQETDPCYCINTNPNLARVHHTAFFDRLKAVYGDQLAEHFRYFKHFNSGLYAVRADSPLWTRYRRNLHKALRIPYRNFLEQDALTVSLFEVGDHLRAPSSMNWLCSMAIPNRRGDGSWCSPADPDAVIHVAHLSNSYAPVDNVPGFATFYDVYRHIGLTN